MESPHLFTRLKWRSVVDYVFIKACDLSMANALKIGPTSLGSNHKPLYLNLTLSPINKCGKVKEQRRYMIQPCYNKATIYVKEVEKHLSKHSLGNDVKENWFHGHIE